MCNSSCRRIYNLRSPRTPASLLIQFRTVLPDDLSNVRGPPADRRYCARLDQRPTLHTLAKGARASKFAIGSDSYSELKAKIDATLLSARTTIVENKLMTNLKESAYDLEDAIDDINCQIAPKALRAAGIVPSEHFHKCLWSTVQSVLKGKRIDHLVQ